MRSKIFEEFDQLLRERTRMLSKFSLTKYRKLKTETDKNVKNIYYGKESLYLGHFCPSLIIDKISNFKRDKLKSTLSKNAKKYVIYEVDENKQLLRMKEVHSYGTVFETYIIRNINEEVSVTFLDGEPTSSVATTRAVYEAGNIVRCDFLTDHSILTELYNYDEIKNNHITCVQIYYVPDQIDSDNSREPGELKSPARRFEIDIEINNQKEIRKLEYWEKVNGKRKVSLIYRGES
jgi:hypothetical protein